jgi:polyribonucleotide nucleotidyltransferase
MDTKTSGVPWSIVEETLARAKDARFQILDHIQSVLPEPRPELSEHAPRITSFYINPEKIRDVIGPGGKMINEIIDTHGVEIDIEDDGLVLVTGVNAEDAQKAVEWIKQITREVEAGEVFEGTVTRLMDFGAFVEILPRTEGLVHISELAPGRTEKVTDAVNVGDTVKVIVYEIDDMGRVNLSIKRLDPDWKEKERAARGPRDDRSSGPRRNGGGDRPRSSGPHRRNNHGK